jgi:hypothetical protein
MQAAAGDSQCPAYVRVRQSPGGTSCEAQIAAFGSLEFRISWAGPLRCSSGYQDLARHNLSIRSRCRVGDTAEPYWGVLVASTTGAETLRMPGTRGRSSAAI